MILLCPMDVLFFTASHKVGCYVNLSSWASFTNLPCISNQVVYTGQYHLSMEEVREVNQF